MLLVFGEKIFQYFKDFSKFYEILGDPLSFHKKKIQATFAVKAKNQEILRVFWSGGNSVIAAFFMKHEQILHSRIDIQDIFHLKKVISPIRNKNGISKASFLNSYILYLFNWAFWYIKFISGQFFFQILPFTV